MRTLEDKLELMALSKWFSGPGRSTTGFCILISQLFIVVLEVLSREIRWGPVEDLLYAGNLSLVSEWL